MPPFLQLHRDDADAVRRELVDGLLARRPRIAPKFLYDGLGSRLFAAITELPEYYPTRVERTVLDRHGPEIAAAVGPGTVMVDLGAGTCEKAARLLPVLRPARYVAVDISVAFVRDALCALEPRFPEVAMMGIGLDFSSGLHLPDAVGDGPRLLFYPGSSIGNFEPGEALRFLSDVRRACGPGGSLLIGVDLVKPVDVLVRAYDDALQVTAAFNRNLVNRVNAVLGADGRVEDVRHVALWNAEASRIEMHLEFVRDAVWRWPGGERRFGAGDRIHTESAHKHTVPGFQALLRDAGFGPVRHWTDPGERFAVMLARA